MASTSSSTSHSPARRPPSPGSPPPNVGDDHPSASVALPRLVSHLIAAKRALSATAHVERANVLVSTARSNVEDIAIFSARTAFLHKYVQRELRLLEGIRRRLEAVAENGADEFKAVLRTLDASDDRVKQTLHLLKTTLVEPSFQTGKETQRTDLGNDKSNPTIDPDPSSDEDGTARQKSLYDFVSEQGVDDLTQVFRQCIDSTNDSTDTFAASNESFDTELQAVADLLSTSSASIGRLQEPGEAAESLFRALESHATEMASLLQSLVRHYDLCVTALKHTEGGGEAAAQAEAHVDIPGGLAELEPDAPHEPISEEERTQMIGVLEKDALEVEDVVQEIRDYAAEMEGNLDVLSHRVETLKSEHARLNTAVSLLDALAVALPGYIQASTAFMERWMEQRAKIEQNLEELEALRDFYDGFLKAYDGLILEIGRRKTVRAKMDKVVADAMAKVAKLYEQDVEEREAFKQEQGEYLPADIWPGLVNPPAKFEIHREGQEAGELPEISKETMQRAMQRHGRDL